MDLLDVSVISAKGYKYILVVRDYFTKCTEAYPLKDKTVRSVADALMDIWLSRYGFPMFLHSDQGKEFHNTMIHKLSELLGTAKTKTTPYHPRSNTDPCNRDHHDARDRSRDHRSHERPTHEDDRGDSSDAQRNSYHSGMSSSMSRPSLSPKVPTFAHG